MTLGAMDRVLRSARGNTAVTAMKYAGVKPGTLLLECLYLLDTAATEELQSGRFLPPTSIRIVVDERGKNHATELGHERINRTRAPVDSETAAQVVRAKAQTIRGMLGLAEQRANEHAPDILHTALTQATAMLDKEIARLKALHSVNPNVRAEEIHFFETRRRHLTNTIEAAKLRLDALRVIVVTQ